MKKIVLIAALAAMTGTASAQDNNSFAPTKGTISTEVLFNPFSDSSKDAISINGLKARYFLTDKDAIRVNLGFNLNSTNTRADLAEPNADASNIDKEQFEHSKDDFTKMKHGDFSISLGYERHLLSHGRIDLYAGAQLAFKRYFASAESEQNKYFTTYPSTENYFYTTKDKYSNYDNNGNYAGTALGAAIFTGIDFYVYKGLYLGAELGLQFENLKQSNYTHTYNEGKNDSKEVVTKYDVSRKSTELKFYVEPNIRLGWSF